MNKKHIENALTILKSQKLVKNWKIDIEKANKNSFLYKIGVFSSKYKSYIVKYTDYNGHALEFIFGNDFMVPVKDILYKQIMFENELK